MMAGEIARCAARMRWFAALAALLAVVGIARSGRAEDAAVPPTVQAELLAKVAAYDRNFAARAGPRAEVLIVVKPGDDDSGRVGAAMQKALGAQATIAGLPHEETVVPFSDAPALARAAKGKRAAVVYLATGFSDEDIAATTRAFDGADVLTVAAVARFVPRGVVLGFDLVSGKPKLLVHLGRARRQNVAFGAEILKLMQVYE
jgi:hypothetical protein